MSKRASVSGNNIKPVVRKERDFSGQNNPSYSHGHNCRGKRSTEYEIWAGIKSRTSNPKNKLYKFYGARGIDYDPKWNSFEAFLEDVGYRPSKEYSLDRIDNNRGYYKSNVRWATRKEQASNKSNNIIIEGVVLKEWCKNFGFNYKTVWRWLVQEHKSVEFVKQRGQELWAKDQTS